MQVFEDLVQFRQWRADLTEKPGFVPTMGALHAGHLALVKQSIAANRQTVVSLFINPAQFDQTDDFEQYPRTLSDDLNQLAGLKVDAVLLPDAAQIYPDNYRYKVTESELSRLYCGATRDGHFDGVLTVVMRLFNLVQPARAYFGEKDWQQLALIKGMVKAFFMPLEIIPMATVREADGLAMSSRNRRLSPKERQLAPVFQQIIGSAVSAGVARSQLTAAGFVVDYVTDTSIGQQNRRLAAVKLGAVRLIDNVALPASMAKATKENPINA